MKIERLRELVKEQRTPKWDRDVRRALKALICVFDNAKHATRFDGTWDPDDLQDLKDSVRALEVNP